MEDGDGEMGNGDGIRYSRHEQKRRSSRIREWFPDRANLSCAWHDTSRTADGHDKTVNKRNYPLSKGELGRWGEGWIRDETIAWKASKIGGVRAIKRGNGRFIVPAREYSFLRDCAKVGWKWDCLGPVRRNSWQTSEIFSSDKWLWLW